MKHGKNKDDRASSVHEPRKRAHRAWRSPPAVAAASSQGCRAHIGCGRTWKRAQDPGTPQERAGATVALSVRLARADWERLHQLPVAQGVSLQEIMVRGLSQDSRLRACPVSAPDVLTS